MNHCIYCVRKMMSLTPSEMANAKVASEYQLEEQKRDEIRKIKDFLEEHPIAIINEDSLMLQPLFAIKKCLEELKDDLILKEGEI